MGPDHIDEESNHYLLFREHVRLATSNVYVWLLHGIEFMSRYNSVYYLYH